MSILWNHFSDEGSEKVRCNYCSIIVSYKKGNRSTMRKHLERKHPKSLGIITTAMTEECFSKKNDEKVNSIPDIYPIFQIESNVQYFIQMIYERPTLYEYSRLIGWNSKQNKVIWQEIADTFQVDVAECQKFWKYLKETYDLHSRNPKLNDHKYDKELTFLGEMYKKRRQRKEELAKQRKLLKTNGQLLIENNQRLQENVENSEMIQYITLEQHKDHKNNFKTQKLVPINTSNKSNKGESNELVETFAIYGPYDISGSPLESHVHTTNYEDDYNEKYDVNEVIMKDVNAENIIFDGGDSALINDKNISNLVNTSTQTDNSSSSSNNNSNKDLDELDLLMEFIKGKVRKFPIQEMNKIQLKILKTVMEAEKDINKNLDIS